MAKAKDEAKGDDEAAAFQKWLPLPIDMDAINQDFETINAELDRVRAPIIEKFQKLLDFLVDSNLNSFEERQRVAHLVQSTAEKLGVALCCPKPGCGKPSKLRCTKSGRSASGYFSFEHEVEGKLTKHGGSSSFEAVKLTKVDEE